MLGQMAKRSLSNLPTTWANISLAPSYSREIFGYAKDEGS